MNDEPLSKATIEGWKREGAEGVAMRKYIFAREWEMLCDLAIKGLSAPPEALQKDAIPMPKEWIEAAKCPNCGGVGWRAIQVEAGVFEQEQCQWCFEQWLALGQPSIPSPLAQKQEKL